MALVAVAAIIAPASSASAAPLRASLEVHRSVGAETCAEQVELTTQIEAIAGAKILSGTEPKPVRVIVHIQRPGPGYVAVIELSGGRTGERTLDDIGPGCEVLSQALAVTIAILLEPDEVELVRNPKKEAPPEPLDFVPPPLTPKLDTSAPALTLTAGAYYDFGTLDESSGGVSLSADTFVPYVSFGLTFLGIPYDPNDRPTRTVIYRFLAARARACTRAPVLEQFGASLCAGILAGERQAQVETAEGELFSASGAYGAANLQLEVSRRVIGPFGVFAELGLSIPFVQEPIDVRIPGLLDATSPYEVVTFQMGAGVRFWFGRGVPST